MGDGYRVVAVTNGSPLAEAYGYCRPTEYMYEKGGKFFERLEDGTYRELEMYSLADYLAKDEPKPPPPSSPPPKPPRAPIGKKIRALLRRGFPRLVAAGEVTFQAARCFRNKFAKQAGQDRIGKALPRMLSRQ